MMDQRVIVNEDNDLKYMTGDLEKEKKKKKTEVITESAEEAPLEYFTE